MPGSWFQQGGAGNPEPMFIWQKNSGERSRVRFLWWPLVASLVLSVLLTIAINAR